MPNNLKELDAVLQSYKEAENPGELGKMLSYSLLSFHLQRPIGRVMIMLLGQSGTGKSATINNLFDDSKLCPTTDVKSQTHEVTEYSKIINFSDFKAYLSLVDTPGTFDTQAVRNEVNVAKIQEFRTRHLGNPNYSTVYPNLLLVTVKASDSRLDEDDSFFSQTLKTIDGTKLLDPSRINLIVVATFSAQIATSPEMFSKEKRRIRNVIAKIVHKILGILNVKIVFVENCPESFRLRKHESSDFYGLPDDELTPLNLFKTISDQFKSNGDFFGSFVTSKYFSNTCVEKKDKAVSKNMREAEQSYGDDVITEFERITEFCEKNRHALFTMNQYSGGGYSPRMECTKTCRISEKFGTYVTREENGDQIDTEKRFLKITFRNKEDYESYRKKMYGMAEGDYLNVSPDMNSIGKWENLEGPHWNIISFLHEEKLGKKSVEEISFTNLTEPLKIALRDLPISNWLDAFGRRAKVEKLRVFCETWGTHYIKNVRTGGSMRIDCSIPPNWSDEEKAELEKRIQRKISFLSTQNGSDDDLENIVGEGYIRITFCGGIPPNVTKLTELTQAMFSEWAKSLRKHPVELENTIELESYDVFLQENQKELFKAATMAFMSDEGPIQRTAKRDIEAAIEENIALMVLWNFTNILTGDATGVFVNLIEIVRHIRRAQSKQVLKFPNFL